MSFIDWKVPFLYDKHIMTKKRLITSALPYVNNIPHLGNLLQVLSADVFARFSRLEGIETLYVCGTDEYGTATETKALEEGISPRELCDRYHAIHRDIYRWFNISFDKFGRTSTPEHTRITQYIFRKLDEAGYISEKTTNQLFCETCSRFLADRYVLGTCPSCGYDGARGDQCESCGKLLDPTDLVSPHCGVCGGTPVLRETRHLYIDLPAILPKLRAWMEKASVEGFWARNAIQMTNAWMRDGLKERCITRDLKWGIPVPKEGFTDKVFYVWFDAPIGYISITASYTDDWESWWKDPDQVELFQFIGKDNIPFHTVIFPSSLLGSGERWTMLHHMSSTEYLNYEGGKFSKSKGIGVFGSDAKETGIPADVYRFYLFYNRPEKSDALFTWKDFQEKVNGELIGNLANLVNRTLTFVTRFYNGTIPDAPFDRTFAAEIVRRENEIKDLLDHAELRDAFRAIFELSSIGNKAFQDGEPWRMRTENPEKAKNLIHDLTYLVRDLGILIGPYMPETSQRIASFFAHPSMYWKDLEASGGSKGLMNVTNPAILFEKLEDDRINALKERFSGSQKERKEMDEKKAQEEKLNKAEQPPEPLDVQFRKKIRLIAARIVRIERHPEAEKLYIETLDTGNGTERTIVSGLVPFYREEQLLYRNIILVENLKPAKLRGIVSEGMLLAASEGDTVEVLFADHAAPGSRVFLEGDDESLYGDVPQIKAERFFEIPIRVENGTVKVGLRPLVCGGRPLVTERVKNGEVG